MGGHGQGPGSVEPARVAQPESGRTLSVPDRIRGKAGWPPGHRLEATGNRSRSAVGPLRPLRLHPWARGPPAPSNQGLKRLPPRPQSNWTVRRRLSESTTATSPAWPGTCANGWKPAFDCCLPSRPWDEPNASRKCLREYDLPVVSDFDGRDRPADGTGDRIAVAVGHVLEGFRHPSSGICIFGDEDVFDEVEFLSHPAPSRSRSGIFVSDFRELSPGDTLVHVDHGIGRYRGLKQIDRDGVSQEFMILEYFDEARLYVPLERLDLVQKHSSGDSARPPLDKLGGVSWKKAKSRARKSIRDMAQELLDLYARRRIAPGIPLFRQRTLASGIRGCLRVHRDPGSKGRHSGPLPRHGSEQPHGPATLRGRGLRQDGSGHAGGLQGGLRRQGRRRSWRPRPSWSTSTTCVSGSALPRFPSPSRC